MSLLSATCASGHGSHIQAKHSFYSLPMSFEIPRKDVFRRPSDCWSSTWCPNQASRLSIRHSFPVYTTTNIVTHFRVNGACWTGLTEVEASEVEASEERDTFGEVFVLSCSR
jgi:hypothetical protein